jgi:hypothetical protein
VSIVDQHLLTASPKGTEMKTLTKVYERHDVARKVVVELETAGFPSSSISIVANKEVNDQYADVGDTSEAGTGAGVGATVGGAAGLLAGLGALAIPGVGPVVAAGWLAVEDNDVVLARSILDRHGAIDPVHRGSEYRESGWKQFDPAASDFVPEGIEVEQAARRVV